MLPVGDNGQHSFLAERNVLFISERYLLFFCQNHCKSISFFEAGRLSGRLIIYLNVLSDSGGPQQLLVPHGWEKGLCKVSDIQFQLGVREMGFI